MKFLTRKRAKRAFLRHKERDACAARPGPSSGKERPSQDDKPWLKIIGLLIVLCASAVNGLTLDREAFSITNYDLNVRVEPEQHRLGARGKITLRNDTQSPQKIAVLQISSSLDWRAIRAGDKTVQFITQSYTSDIDHTGGFSEAIVTLPQAIAPHGTIDLEIAYEGVILLDATRLTRIGTPEDVAKSTDWDQINVNFTAVRGVGYVAWYPIATEAANLSEGDLFEVLGRWKAREAGSQMQIAFEDMKLRSTDTACLLHNLDDAPVREEAICKFEPLGNQAPNFVIANYKLESRPSVDVFYFPGHETSATKYADEAKKLVPFITDWFGAPHEKVRTADLPDAKAAPFENGSLLFTPLTNDDSKLAGLEATHQLTHAAFASPRLWINEGLAHFAQALYLEHDKNRQAALDYMGVHRAAFVETEKSPSDETGRSLVNTPNEELYRSKAMCVWWMLRDMIGDAALKKALAAYKPGQDTEPSYMPRLISAETQRDLQWFFDDWVYHDRGLPDFKIESAFPRKTATETYMVTITIDNLGTAGAEVPIIVKSAGADAIKRIGVRAKTKATIRMEAPAQPLEIVVNDGSIPESNMANNVFKVTSDE
jgi:hypothetical protein